MNDGEIKQIEMIMDVNIQSFLISGKSAEYECSSTKNVSICISTLGVLEKRLRAVSKGNYG